MSLRDVLVHQIAKVVLEHKDEYIELAKDQLVKFVHEIRVEGHDQPVIDEIVANFTEIADLILKTYHLLKALVDKYGHPRM
jgi:hypothetical protein